MFLEIRAETNLPNIRIFVRNDLMNIRSFRNEYSFTTFGHKIFVKIRDRKEKLLPKLANFCLKCYFESMIKIL